MPGPPPKLTASLQNSIELAFRLAVDCGHEYLTLEHLLYSFRNDAVIRMAIRYCDGNPAGLWRDLEEHIYAKSEPQAMKVEREPTPTLAFGRVLERAAAQAVSSESGFVDKGAVLASMLLETKTLAAHLLQKHGVNRLPLLRFLSHGPGRRSFGAGRVSAPEGTTDRTGGGRTADSAGGRAGDGTREDGKNAGESPEMPEVSDFEDIPFGDGVELHLDRNASDLMENARRGHIDPLVGRGAELDRLVRVLCRRRKNNPLLVGEAGVGKTVLAKGLALRILKGEVPESLGVKSFHSLDMGALMAGARYRGEFEERFKSVLDALSRLKDGKKGAILFIDDIHTLVGGGAAGGGLDAGSLLKPYLDAGSLRCIGASTHEDLRGGFEKDSGLARRFQAIEVAEPSEAEAIEILKGLKGAYEAHHGTVFSDAAVDAAVRLSARHLRDRFLPDKALDVMDEAGVDSRLLADEESKREIGPPEIEAVISRMARVPLQSVSDGDEKRLAGLEAALKSQIYGQDGVIERVVSAIKLSRSGLRGFDRPSGCFLFAGPTGVGKTELARQLALALGVPFLRYDMSEYMEKHTVSRLIGAPPGYVGFEDGGHLVEAVRKQPHSVLLLDEIEKAHYDLFSILLQVMDHATLTDAHGRKADFRHVVLILTTNAGSKDIGKRRTGFQSAADPPASVAASGAKAAIEKAFSPEFRNRLDATMYFRPLGKPEILRVVGKFAGELQTLLDEKNVKLSLSGAVVEWLAQAGHDPAMGARPMARAFEEHIKRPLADEILFGTLKGGGTAMFELVDGALGLKAKGGKEAKKSKYPEGISEAQETEKTAKANNKGPSPTGGKRPRKR